MTPIEQLKSVLCDHTGKCSINGSDEDRATVDRALQAIAEQIAPVQVPVAHLWKHSQTGRTRVVMPGGIITADACWFVVGPLILGGTTPPAAPAQCEWCNGRGVLAGHAQDGSFDGEDCPHCAPPAAQRQWVGLTDREVGAAYDFANTNSRYSHHHTGFWMDFYSATEAKLKEKNT